MGAVGGMELGKMLRVELRWMGGGENGLEMGRFIVDTFNVRKRIKTVTTQRKWTRMNKVGDNIACLICLNSQLLLSCAQSCLPGLEAGSTKFRL